MGQIIVSPGMLSLTSGPHVVEPPSTPSRIT